MQIEIGSIYGVTLFGEYWKTSVNDRNNAAHTSFYKGSVTKSTGNSFIWGQSVRSNLIGSRLMYNNNLSGDVWDTSNANFLWKTSVLNENNILFFFIWSDEVRDSGGYYVNGFTVRSHSKTISMRLTHTNICCSCLKTKYITFFII